ncbi:DNA/RNA non-specific endonuclease [Actinomadura graeca]|uniref:DNA/RNA non-specific endonuclease n=1 Tax=Actinomadura graeca TaxID=2750812 RepID=A0ABX8R459_9ACTN|nr:DNA/RNA non-specific endonuclease [Actinomadura graeca]QXJ25870.1 DNA/RNA non-specific endonuclease [Actinomadura graeca]
MLVTGALALGAAAPASASPPPARHAAPHAPAVAFQGGPGGREAAYSASAIVPSCEGQEWLYRPQANTYIPDPRPGVGYRYHIDAQGRPDQGLANNYSFRAEPGQADNKCRGDVGHYGGKGYHGGHLIGYESNGPTFRANLVPQWGQINSGVFQVFEKGIRACARTSTTPGTVVETYSVRVTYAATTTVIPNGFTGTARVHVAGAASTITQQFPNAQIDNQQSQQIRDSINTQLQAAGCKS